MIKCNGRKRRRNNPASAITNFFEMEENRILVIANSVFNCPGVTRMM
jgi:hypothetical protein